MKQATIVGAGLVGSLWAVYLAKAGYKVNIFERRGDMRKANMVAGRSINLAASFRAWKALDGVGIGDEVRKIAIPMTGRVMHPIEGELKHQPYGINDQAIYSVSRGLINAKLMDLAEQNEYVNIFFNHECLDTDLKTGTCTFKNKETNEIVTSEADIVFAADGTFSAIRYKAMQKLDRFSYSQNFVEDGYRELLLPANEDGTYKLDPNSLHIWPRGRFMMIALPNFDGSFTCTLFMPFDGHEYCFNKLTSKEKVENFFKELFPDFFEMLPNVADEWEEHPLSSLAIIRCYPWVSGKIVLMGDAAHATVPFYGQGMNCGFEDCSELAALMYEHNHDWDIIGEAYQTSRKPNGDAMQDLSQQNYLVMRNRVADPDFLLLQKIERRIAELYPTQYFPLYTMVSFTDIAYKTALDKGNEQEKNILDMIAKNNIKDTTPMEVIDGFIHQQLNVNS
jgi:kynurenine 3-monooxygenase